MDHDSKEFFIEISSMQTLEALTKTSLLNILELAEQCDAEKVYVCCRRVLGDISNNY